MNEDDQDRADAIVAQLRAFDGAEDYCYDRQECYIKVFRQDAELLVAEIDRLRRELATAPPTTLTLMEEADEPDPPTCRHCNVNESGPNCCFGRCKACCRDPGCEDHGTPPVPDDPDMLSEFTEDERPRF